MKKIIKLFGILLMGIIVVLSMPTQEVYAVTQNDAVVWARSKLNNSMDYDGNGSWCVDPIYYYYRYLGQPSPGGNACDFATRQSAVPAGWTRLVVTSGFVPQPGDIAVWKTNYVCSTCWICETGVYGHVGIVTSADSYWFYAVNQCSNGRLYCTEDKYRVDALQCVIRPNFTSALTVTATESHTCGYQITIPANLGVTCYTTATGTTPAGTSLEPWGASHTVRSTQKLTMSDGSTRYKLYSNGLYIIFQPDVMQAVVNHSMKAELARDATCTESGLLRRWCSKCNEEWLQNFPSARGHDYQDTDTTVGATCTSLARVLQACTRCDKEIWRPLFGTGLGHSYEEEFSIDVFPTCIESGEKSRHCIRCDAKTDITSIPATYIHEWTEIWREGPLCPWTGYILYRCPQCTQMKRDPIPESDHIYEKRRTVNPTCTEDGYVVDICRFCFERDEESLIYIPASGHDWSEWQVDDDPFYRYCMCLSCGDYAYEHVEILRGWNLIDNTWYYLNADGALATGWLFEGAWYYLNADGSMATGWVNDGGTWYYMNAGGAMYTGWLNDGGTWYYMNAGGAMMTGWVNDGGTWYYMNAGGAMMTGWVNDGGTWYYMNAGGAMHTGWLNDGGTWYYMNSGGAMVTGWALIDGAWYFMDASGVWVA